MGDGVSHGAVLGKGVLKLDAANPFRNLPQSFFVDTDGKADIAFAGFTESIARSGDYPDFVEQFGR